MPVLLAPRIAAKLFEQKNFISEVTLFHITEGTVQPYEVPLLVLLGEKKIQFKEKFRAQQLTSTSENKNSSSPVLPHSYVEKLFVNISQRFFSFEFEFFPRNYSKLFLTLYDGRVSPQNHSLLFIKRHFYDLPHF